MTFEPERMPADNMLFIDPHIYIISRTTDDYQAMRTAGVVAVIEPGFWVGSRVRGGNFPRLFLHAGWMGAFPRGAVRRAALFRHRAQS
jgi:hypothetical protein